MTLATKLRFEQTQTLKSGQIYNFILEHKSYQINEPDQFLENSRISFFAFLDTENNLHHFNRLEAKKPAKTKLNEVLQIPSIIKIQIFEVTRANEQEMNAIKVEELDPIELEQVQLLKKLLGIFLNQVQEHYWLQRCPQHLIKIYVILKGMLMGLKF